MILLFVGIGLEYSSCNVSGEIGKTAYHGNVRDLTNNNSDTRNYSCSNNTNRLVNHKCRKNETCTCVGPNIENRTWGCTCQNNTTCSSNNCTFNNCTCQELGANNNSSGISCARNGPCLVNGTINQITLNKEKKGRIFTMTLNCPRCT